MRVLRRLPQPGQLPAANKGELCLHNIPYHFVHHLIGLYHWCAQGVLRMAKYNVPSLALQGKEEVALFFLPWAGTLLLPGSWVSVS